jgi:hypothetical protein
MSLEAALCADGCGRLAETERPTADGRTEDVCRSHACTCPPHMDGIGREKWPDCPTHTLGEHSSNPREDR